MWEERPHHFCFLKIRAPRPYTSGPRGGDAWPVWLHLLSEMGILRPREEQRFGQSAPNTHPTPIPHLGIWDLHT